MTTTPTDLPTDVREDRATARADGAPLRALAWPITLVVVVVGVVLFFLHDLEFDIAQGVPPAHVTIESVFILFAVVGVVGSVVQLRGAVRRWRQLQRDLRCTREDAERWRSEAEALARRVGVAVDAHFSEWGLTSAEKEIALLVLRGLSYKEVASVRGTAERTVRHQALAIYRKAGVAGRAEMAAVFLQDVLAGAPPHRQPQEPAEPPAAARPPPTLVG